jgi:hypothetical protein
MTRICEKFVEDLSSGSTDIKGEFQAHLAVCNDCQQAIAAARQLKQQRRPISGKEATAISAIMKKVAASSASAGSTGSVISTKFIITGILATAMLCSLYLNHSLREQNSPQNKASMAATAENSPGKIVPAENQPATATEMQEISAPDGRTNTAATLLSGASDSSSLESTATGPAQIMISPDQEEINPH